MSNYRPSPFANIPPVIKNLLIINIICFVPTLIVQHPDNTLDPFTKWLGLYYFNSPLFHPWQIVTHMFMHGGWEHIIFNMFALYSFGPAIEYLMGSKRFFNFYFLCGFGAMALQMLVQAVEVHNLVGSFTLPNPQPNIPYFEQFGAAGQKLFEIYMAPTIGASGAIFGVLIAFGMMFPNAELLIMFIPVPVKAKYIIPIYIVVELFLGFGRLAGDDVAHFAHIGGALIGFLLVKFWRLQRPNNFFS
jgi:rhomboid-like protein